jgi:hypothetical protein
MMAMFDGSNTLVVGGDSTQPYVEVGVLVMLFEGLLAKHTAKTPPESVSQPA